MKSIRDFNQKNKFKISNIYYIDWDSNIRNVIIPCHVWAFSYFHAVN
jgi:hypothetical protein